VSFAIAVGFEVFQPAIGSSVRLVLGVAITTVAWVGVTLLTRPTDEATLRRFYRLARPGGPGWRRVAERAAAAGEAFPDPAGDWTVPRGILAMVAGCMAVYAALFATGYWIYGRYALAAALTIVAIGSAVALARIWGAVAGRPPGAGSGDAARARTS
jgi:solute:Na+ symporter, SSS family